MTNLPYDYDSLPLAEQASYHIRMLGDIIEKISGLSGDNEAMAAKKQQHADLSKMIRQWESLGIPVSEELRMMNLGLGADLSHVHEMAASTESIKRLLQELLGKIPDPGTDGGVSHRRRTRRKRSETGTKTPLSAFRHQILEILTEAGGKAASAEVKIQLEKRIGHTFTERDLEFCNDGRKTVWWDTAQWERVHMVNEGLLRKGSPRGVWEVA